MAVDPHYFYDFCPNPHQMCCSYIQEQNSHPIFSCCHSQFLKISSQTRISFCNVTCTNSKASTSSSLCASHAGVVVLSGLNSRSSGGGLLSRISKCVSFTKGNVGLYKHLKQANLLQHVEQQSSYQQNSMQRNSKECIAQSDLSLLIKCGFLQAISPAQSHETELMILF